MSKKNQTRTKERVLARFPRDTTARCCKCKQILPIEKFWDNKKRKINKTCYPCLAPTRKSAYIKRRQARDPSYQPRPQGQRRANYVAYLNSPEWAAKRREYWVSGLARQCYVCGDPWVNFQGKQLHHRTYKRLGNEQLSDLVPVCRECHEVITERWVATKNEQKGTPRHGRKNLWDVTEDVAQEYRPGDRPCTFLVGDEGNVHGD